MAAAGVTQLLGGSVEQVFMAAGLALQNMLGLVYDPVIPLDETICAMYKAGQMMPAELRCTCKGGLCATKTGEKIAHNL